MAAGGKIGKLLAVVFILAALALFAGGAWYGYQYMEESARIASMRGVVERDTFYDNIIVDGIDISGMSYNDALRAVTAQNTAIADEIKLSIVFEGRQWSIDAQTLNIRFNTEDIINEAYALCRDGDLQQRYEQIESLRTQGASFTTEYTLDDASIDTLTDEIAAAVYIEPVDAAVQDFDFNAKRFLYTDESSGRDGDVAAAIAEAKRRVAERDFSDTPIGVTTHVLEPEVTKASLEKVNKKLSSATTTAKKDTNRNNNITLAMESINKVMVMPGETFSFNEATGARTEAKGYKEAGAIKNGVLIPEFGGGVCQVSTTLYNAIAKANLQIVERNPHSFPSTYVDIAKDAMVDYPNSDFKFTNNTTSPLVIITHFAEQKLVVDIYGASLLEEGVSISIRSETTETIPMPDAIITTDLTLYPGMEEVDREGRKGYRSIAYKDFVKDGTVIKTEVLNNSYYRPIAPKIRVNPNNPPVVTHEPEVQYAE